MRVALFTFVGLGLLCCSSPERKFNGGGKAGGAGGTSGAAMEPAGSGGRMVGGGIGGSDVSDAGQAGEAGAGGSDGTGEGGAPGGPECTANEYEKTAPTANSDRECSPLSVCGAGTMVSVKPTDKSDRQCSPCPANTFSSNLNTEMCSAWSTCKSGQSESVAPSATSDRVCSTCGSGKYESNSQCLPLTTCTTTEYEAAPATATSDRKCSALTVCQAGSRQTAAPTTTTDRQCAACSAGTFSTQTNATSCSAWTACTSNQTLTKAGTSTSDAVCTDKPACGTAVDRACTVDCPCASGEGVCTANNQCASGASCVVDGGKKMGRAGNTCFVAHCDNDKKDADETSVDCGGSCGCRATFEVVSFKNIPSGTSVPNDPLSGMSADGSRFAATISRGGTAVPTAIAADGTITELPAYGSYGYGKAISADGNVIVGEMGCSDPPTCSSKSTTEVKWTGTAAPQIVIYDGAARYLSSSGTYVGGSMYNATLGKYVGFINNGNMVNEVDELSYVYGMTKDGKYLLGSLPDASGGGFGLFLVSTRAITKLNNASWNSTSVDAVNGNTPVVIGKGYINASDLYVGFRWKAGVFTSLGVLSGTTYSAPTAISNDGNTVVGTTFPLDVAQAFIWTETDKLRTIVDELKNRGYEPPSDMLLKYPKFISEDGKTIVGVDVSDPPLFWRVVLN